MFEEVMIQIGTGDADARSQSQLPMNWESRGCEKSKPPKAA